jgi:cell division protein FtsW
MFRSSKRRPSRHRPSSPSRLHLAPGKPNLLILLLTLGLTLFGIIMVYDASSVIALSNYGSQWYFLKYQALWALFGLLLATLAYLTPLSLWQKLARPLFFANLLLLALVLIPGIGDQHHGGRRWLVLGTLNLQPSELLKITLPLYLSSILSAQARLKDFLTPLTASLFLVILEPDLSTTLILGLTGLSVYWAAGAPVVQLLSLSLAALLGGGILSLISPYRVSRLLTFFDPSRDPLGTSYHIRQILIALGSGGLTGVGIGQSRQKYAYLPAAPTDSIFAVIAEEIGFAGAAFLILLLAVLIFKSFRIASQVSSKFASLLATGLTSWIALQTLVNLAAVVVLIPVTGVTLPFISYGGSSLVATLVSIAIILRISATNLPQRTKRTH